MIFLRQVLRRNELLFPRPKISRQLTKKWAPEVRRMPKRVEQPGQVRWRRALWNGGRTRKVAWYKYRMVNECELGQRSGGEVVNFVTVSAAPSDHDEGG